MGHAGFHIALVGASSRKGREVKEVLEKRSFPIRRLPRSMKRNGRDRTGSCGYWLWAAADNLRLLALNAVRIAEELGRVRIPRPGIQ